MLTRIGFRTAGVRFDVSFGRHAEDVPLDVEVILREVHAVGDRVVVRLRVDVDEIDLEKNKKKGNFMAFTSISWMPKTWVSHDFRELGG